MIISRTPLRISFFGGGTDLRSYYRGRSGRVISTGIQKYLYVMLREQVGFVEHRYRVNWSRIEFCRDIDEIEHPIVREAYRRHNVDFPIELSTFSDIPAGTGLGSSSTFAVGLLNALYALRGERVTKYQLATEAAELEIDVLGRVMGKQDHFAASYGKPNVYTFNPDESVDVEPILFRRDRLDALERRLLLFYTGQQRDAAEILAAQNEPTTEQVSVLGQMVDLIDPMSGVLEGSGDIGDIGPMLDKGWNLKRAVSDRISSPKVDDLYRCGMAAGATGGKLLGAGGGGFLMLFAEPKFQDAVIAALAPLQYLRPGFDESGSRITYYEPSRFS